MITRTARTLLVMAIVLATAGLAASGAQVSTKTVTLKKARAGYYSIKVQYPAFAGSSAVAKKANAELARLARTRFAGYQKDAKDALTGVGKPTFPYDFMFTPTVSVAKPDIISVYFTEFSFTGGAHPNTVFAAASFGLVNGTAKKLNLADLFKPGVDARQVAAEQVYDRLKSKPGAVWVKEGTITAKSPELTRTFAISAAGLTFLIPPYDVGPYSSGPFVVKIPFSAFGSKLAPAGPLKPLL